MSEYEHYKNYDYSSIELPQMDDLPDFVVSSVFSYEKEGIGELLSLFGGVGQRLMFWANKNKIIEALISQYESQIQEMKNSIWSRLSTYEQERKMRCSVILNNSYEKIVGEMENVERTMQMMKNCIEVFAEPEKLEIHLYEMLSGGGKSE